MSIGKTRYPPLSRATVVTAYLVLLSILNSCAVGPDYRRPVNSLPAQWQNHSPTAKALTSLDAWWTHFHDPILNQLIQDATNNNLDYRQSLAVIKDLRAQRSATIAAGLPSLDARSNLSRRFNNTSAAGQSGGANAGAGFGIGNQNINIFQLGFDAQWELDFFGGFRRAIEAADATLAAEIESSHDVLITLQAEIARQYIELRNQQQLLAISRDNLAAQQDSLQLTQVRQSAGLATQLDVAEAELLVSATKAQLPDYQRTIQQAIHALSLLVGREPGALQTRLESTQHIPALIENAQAYLPVELLQRRPDIRRAERQLALANAQIGIATAELYPKVNLAAFLGLQNMNITGFTPLGKSWSSAASLSMPLFNWGKLQANISSKTAQFEQHKLAYQQSLLNALKDVEDALIAQHSESEKLLALQLQIASNREALSLATSLYQRGLSNYINVLQHQQSLYQAEISLANSQAIRSKSQIALFKALGGGWQIAIAPVSKP